MWKNYCVTALRNLRAHKAVSAINIIGLTIGIACFTTIVLYIQQELSYDRYHPNADRAYRVVEIIRPAEHSSSQPFNTGPTLINDFPGMIEHAVRFFNMQAPTLNLDNGPEKRFPERRFFFVDSNVFEIFDVKFIAGDKKTALAEPNSLVLTREMAVKYFGQEQVIGRTLRFEGKYDLKITGTIESVPENTHLRFDFLCSFSTLNNIQGINPRGWNWNPCWTYVSLAERVSAADLEARFPEFVERHFPDNIRANTSLHLQRLTDIHLHSRLDYEIEPNGSMMYVSVFMVIAVMVLLVACINYMNLSTARAGQRAREVGMRKVLGARRAELVLQFLSESLITAFFAVLLSVPLVQTFLKLLNHYFGLHVTFSLVENSLLLSTLLASIGLIGILGGLYPALMLSSFRPILVLKGRIRLAGSDWTNALRKALVVAQFSISIVLIIGTLFAFKQLSHFRNAELGFEKQEPVMMINMFRAQLASRYEDLKNRLLDIGGVLKVTTAENVLGSKYQSNFYRPQGFDQNVQFHRLMVGYDFVETFNLEIVAGRSFDRQFATDDSLSIIINEAMVGHLQWGSPHDAVGRTFQVRNRTATVIGVVKDFHYASLHDPIKPFVLDIADTEFAHNFLDRYLVVRLAGGDIRNTINQVRSIWSEYLPDRTFEYFFADEELDKLYRAEESLGRIAGVFSFLALFVACIGLVGIVSFIIEVRTKELGIRKVVGATTINLFVLLSGGMLKPIVVSMIIATPVGFVLVNRWLDQFAYRTDLSWMPFIIANTFALAVALITISNQIMKVSRMNPVHTLRYE